MVDLAKRKLFTRKSHDEITSTLQGPLLPWLKDRASFYDACTRCGQCIEACDTNIIIKASGGFPTIDFSRGECTFCEKCALSCPEHLFHAPTQAPWEIRAKINQGCLAFKNVECRTCGDECEPLAIQFSYLVGQVAQPKLDTELCTGCGACIKACPVSAISMTDLKEDKNACE